jgi:hypothetical protein
MYAAAFQDKVEKLIMIDGFGPLVQPYDTVAQSLRIAIEAEIKFKRQNRPVKVYNTLKDAIDQRSRAANDYPGQQFLGQEAAKLIVERAVKLVENDNNEDVTDETAGPVQFRHDRRQLLPSYTYTTKEQVLSFNYSFTFSFLKGNSFFLFLGVGIFSRVTYKIAFSTRR